MTKYRTNAEHEAGKWQCSMFTVMKRQGLAKRRKHLRFNGNKSNDQPESADTVVGSGGQQQGSDSDPDKDQSILENEAWLRA